MPCPSRDHGRHRRTTGIVTETTPGSRGILPVGTQASLNADPNDAGFTVTFAGLAANADVVPLTVTNPLDTGGAAVICGSVRETVKGTAGGRVDDRWHRNREHAHRHRLHRRVRRHAGSDQRRSADRHERDRRRGRPGPGADPRLDRRQLPRHHAHRHQRPAPSGADQGVVPMCGNTHTITKYYDDVSNTLSSWNQRRNTTAAAVGAHDVSCVQQPLRQRLRGGGRDSGRPSRERRGSADLRIPVGGNGNCHDVNVFEELHFMATACSGTGGAQIVDMTNISTGGTTPLLPGIGFSWPGLQTSQLPDDQLERQVRVRERRAGRRRWW